MEWDVQNCRQFKQMGLVIKHCLLFGVSTSQLRLFGQEKQSIFGELTNGHTIIESLYKRLEIYAYVLTTDYIGKSWERNLVLVILILLF